MFYTDNTFMYINHHTL